MSERREATFRGDLRRRSGIVVALSAAALLLLAVPAAADDSGSIDATVTVEGPCITVPAATIEFPPFLLSSPTENFYGPSNGWSVESCSTQNLVLYGRASDAVGSGTGGWTLEGWDEETLMCDQGPDVFGAGIYASQDSQEHWFAAGDALLGPLAAESLYSFNPLLLMPCSNSSGVGETMTFTYTFTAAMP